MKGLWTLIIRELRDQSRQPTTYWLRVLALASLLLVMLSLRTSNFLYGSSTGRILFSQVNGVLFACIWIFVPLLVSDCISREKREGTLGLLFLTPLTGGSIMAAKSFVHALRASALLLAALPALAIPIVLGGVTESDLIQASIVNTAALIFALLAGLLASLLSTRWTRATLLAVVFGMLTLYLFVHAYCGLSAGAMPNSFRTAWIETTSVYGLTATPPARIGGRIMISPAFYQIRTTTLGSGIGGTANYSVAYGQPGQFMVPASVFGRLKPITPAPPTAAQTDFGPGLSMLGIAIAAFFALWLWAARRLPLVLSAPTRTKAQAKLEQRFCTPVLFANAFRRNLRATLERNPIGWLEQYSWSARLTKWGWCMAALLFEMFVFHNAAYEEYQSSPPWFFPVLLAALALSASNSFSREKESGALELLLVTPLSEHQIIWGRLFGLWMQVLPAIGFYAVMYQAFHASPGDYFWSNVMVETTLCAAVIGLCFSLTRWNLFVRWIATLLVVLSPWAVVSTTLGRFLNPGRNIRFEAPPFSILQLAFAIGAFFFLQRRLQFRQFSLVPTEKGT